MKILILGSEGSMGKRYQAILNYLGLESICIDRNHSDYEIQEAIEECDRVIIATPTHTHSHYIRWLLPFRKPILCEKPVTKDLEELKSLLREIGLSRTPFRMMYQYSMLTKDSVYQRKSSYNYFRHGSDGLIWDCMQIIGLSKGEIELKESSPIWECAINGVRLDLASMDRAYIDYVRLWLNYPSQDLEEILEVHEKVHRYFETTKEVS